jgi:hypothetical protein
VLVAISTASCILEVSCAGRQWPRARFAEPSNDLRNAYQRATLHDRHMAAWRRSLIGATSA